MEAREISAVRSCRIIIAWERIIVVSVPCLSSAPHQNGATRGDELTIFHLMRCEYFITDLWCECRNNDCV